MNYRLLDVIANSFSTIYKYLVCPNPESEECTDRCSNMCVAGPKRSFADIAGQYIKDKKLESKRDDFESLPQKVNRYISDFGSRYIEDVCSKSQLKGLLRYLV